METASAFKEDVALIDGNQKVSGGVLQGEGDEFLVVYDPVNWVTAWIVNEAIAEAGGMLNFTSVGGINYSNIRRNYLYLDADYAIEWADIDLDGAQPILGESRLELGRPHDGGACVNGAWLQYHFRSLGTLGDINVYKTINGVNTVLFNVNIGAQVAPEFRIRRRASDGTFWFYYDIGGGWVLLNAAPFTIFDAVFFNAGHTVYPYHWIINGGAGSTALDSYIERFYQVTVDIAAQQFWSDDPIIYIVDNGGVEWAFDAVTGTWRLAGASAVLTEPGVSTVKFKVGWSDDGTFVGTTWVDGAFQTIAQVNANAAAGLYDDHRYLHVQAQHHSTGPDQPTLTSFSITGSVSTPRGMKHHNQMRRIKYGHSRIG